MGRPAIDLTGKRFGKLVVIKRSHNERERHAKWICKCDCGNEHIASSNSLRSGGVRSCGCITIENHLTHGQTGSRLYNVWNSMKQRCFNPNCKEFKSYGGRGITMCSEWAKDFTNFKKWAEDSGYDSNAKRGQCTIDRIDVNGNYEPQNCRIATQKEQCNNTRKNIKVEIEGRFFTLNELSFVVGTSYGTLHDRYRHHRKILNKSEEEKFAEYIKTDRCPDLILNF